tara:strand:+ start:259 stop:1767 length:1509 start_codon:yes stop_codon:yes gene_type:complete
MKIVFNFVRLFIVIFSIIFTYLAFDKHQGNSLYYLIFSFLINIFFIYSLNKKKLFFEIFFSTLIWLGFWFKYTMSLVFLNGTIYDSGPPFNILNIDKALIPSIIAISAVFLSYIIRQKFFDIKINVQNHISIFEKIYLENKNLIMFLFILSFCVIAFLNFQFSIYQKGFIYPHNISSILINFVKWMLLFGLTTFSCFFIYTEILRFKKFSPFIIFVTFTEIFISYSSMLSRLLILAHAAIAYSFTKYWNLIKNKIIFFIALFLLIATMFVANNYFSNHFRINYTIDITSYEQDKEHYITKREKLKKLLASKNYTEEDLLEFEIKSKPGRGSTSLFLVINRWIGLESMLAIVSTDKLSFDLFFQSLKEKKIVDSGTFYETTFYVDYDDGKKVSFGEKRVLKGNTLPGIITFLFYTGNYYFLFISMFILTLIFCLLEIYCIKVSNKNMIFAAFISYTVAFRLSNFGYAPGDSYLYLISIAASMLLIFILSNYKGLFFKKLFNLN